MKFCEVLDPVTRADPQVLNPVTRADPQVLNPVTRAAPQREAGDADPTPAKPPLRGFEGGRPPRS